ncbi:diguanylate cyclase [Haliea sp. E1-2-M8]|uniref:sensor domain-containing diguanylate cyclase n=1 Tax=Haliea sp. E1-2-M8 TaxID=3064706 RepID=UPI002727AF68|nr:sensor domain-containing diguanylate cyclase [Haliea sp. E1-2-M8]MDO8860403.1 diguanylate cyclase [Haliea sp. E1-2-M8]
MVDKPLFSEDQIESALAACDGEPVHIPGAVQLFGVLIGLDRELKCIEQVSANSEDFLGISVQECLSVSPQALLGKRVYGSLREGIADRDQLPPGLVLSRKVENRTRRFHVTAYRTGDSVVVELEPVVQGVRYRWQSLVNEYLNNLVSADTEAALLNELVGAARAVTGHDRTLVYRFDEDWNGRVVAESHNERLPSLLNHHFPASDIPPQVRSLYAVNQLRFIADAYQDPAPLVPPRDKPLDLSSGALRAVSPVHRKYMRNMGTATSLSVAIHSNTGLWGLLACHKRDAAVLTPSLRASVAILVRVATQRLFLLKAEAEARYRDEIHQNRISLAREVQEHGPEQILAKHAVEWLRLFQAQGVALVYRDHTSRHGCAPDMDRLVDLAAWLAEGWHELNPWSTTDLEEAGYPGACDIDCGCCGVLAMPLVIDVTTRGWLLFFRREEVETIDWAGEPQKVLERLGDEIRLSPRQSFSVWREEVQGRSLVWQPEELVAARDLGDDLAVLASAHEVTHLNERLQTERKALARANKHLHELATTDSLTGIINRYRIDHLVRVALANAERYGHAFSLVLFDIDHFKKVNDTYGHEEGDRILKTLVSSLKSCLREGDQLGRWGGEEFLVLAPYTDLDGATEFAERLRARVEATDFGLRDPVTVSLGVAEWLPGDSLKSLLVRADGAMYRAKETGRNRVVAASGQD